MNQSQTSIAVRAKIKDMAWTSFLRCGHSSTSRKRGLFEGGSPHGVATSSVTRLMDALEKSLGSALLTRTTRHVTLTDAGSAYLEQITRVLSDLDEADGSVSDTGADAVGPLRVSMPVTFGRLCLGPHIAGFLQQHPRVSLDLVLSDAYLDLATERIDVAVRIGTPANQPNLIVNRLAEHHRYVVASRDYLESNGMPASPDDLRNHQCLRFAYQAAVQRWSFTRAGSTEHVEINGRLSVNNSGRAARGRDQRVWHRTASPMARRRRCDGGAAHASFRRLLDQPARPDRLRLCRLSSESPPLAQSACVA